MPERTYLPLDAPFDPEMFRVTAEAVAESLRSNRQTLENFIAEVDAVSAHRAAPAPPADPPTRRARAERAVPVAARHLRAGDHILLTSSSGAMQWIPILAVSPAGDGGCFVQVSPAYDLCNYNRNSYPAGFSRNGCQRWHAGDPDVLVTTDIVGRGPHA